MNRVQASVLAVLLVAVTGLLTGAVPGAEQQFRPDADTSTTSLDRGSAAETVRVVEADTVTFRITVFANASARWSIVYTRALENDTERQQFRAFAEEFNQNETATFRNFKEQARGLTAFGRNQTDREMYARNFSKEAYVGGKCAIPDNCGTVRMSFVWTEFARTDGDRLIVDDVFDGGGLYLGRDKSIVFAHGPDVRFAQVSPDPDSMSDPDSLAGSSTVTWQGERDFSDRRPRVVYLPPDQVETPTPTPTAGTGSPTPTATSGGGPATKTPTTASPGPSAGGSMPMLLLGGLFVVVLGAGLAFVRHRSGGGAPAATVDEGPGGDESGAAATAAAGGVSGEPAVPDEELLTDEDKVVSMLRENGGRMKQVDIVDETGWSKSKVSMLLSDMEDEDEISKLRVGRENIVSLSGHEPEAAKSPHDEE